MVKALLVFDDCAGGKLLVVPPKALLPPNMFEPLLSPPMGAVAPKLKLGCCCPPPKFTLCDRPCAVALAVRWCNIYPYSNSRGVRGVVFVHLVGSGGCDRD